MERIPLEENLKIIQRVKEELGKLSAHLLFLTISGSDLYGFASEDSDFDVRGCFIYNTSNWVGLQRPKDVINIQEGQNDIELYEVSKFIGLALKSNCNLLEHLSTKGIYSTPEFLILKDLLITSFGKAGLLGSYKGMATWNYKKFIASGRKNSVKKYLYVFRSLLAGIYALQTSRIEPNIEILNAHYKFPEVQRLIRIKKSGKEQEELPKDMDRGQIEGLILKLFEKIDQAYIKSALPIEPSQEDVKDIEKWLITQRKRYFD